jgi:hypothetical protein
MEPLGIMLSGGSIMEGFSSYIESRNLFGLRGSVLNVLS